MNMIKKINHSSNKGNSGANGLSTAETSVITKVTSNNFKLKKNMKPTIPEGKHIFQIIAVNYRKFPVIWFTLECVELEGNPKVNLFVHIVKKNGEYNWSVVDKLIALYEDMTDTEVVDDLDYKNFDNLLGKYLEGNVVINEYQGKKQIEVNIFSLEAVDIELIEDDSGVQEGVEEEKDTGGHGVLLKEVESKPVSVPTNGSDINKDS